VIAADLAGAPDLTERLASLSDRIRSGIDRAIGALGRELQRNAQEKLSGQVLQRRSGRLVASIAASVVGSGDRVSAIVGSDLPYAHAQEYGFAGTVGVHAQLRHITMAFGRPIGARTITVGAYSRRMDLPERSFLHSALAEMAGEIETRTAAAVADAVRR
jgi:phage gpG-like protein